MSDKRVVLVTGASSGIGKCCAEYLSLRGYQVYGTSRKEVRNSGSYQMIRMDVTEESSVKEEIEHILDHESRIDVVVNNAGVALIGSMEDASIEEVKWQMEANFFGALRVSKAILPTMRNQGAGHIVNISSIGGLIGLPFQSAYCASKFALEGAMESLRMEVGPYGIQVVLIEPGDFKTDLTGNRKKATASRENGVYGNRMAKALQVVESGEYNGPGPDVIGRLVHKVINKKSPRLRYTVGNFSQRIAVPLKKILPTALFETLMSNHFRAN